MTFRSLSSGAVSRRRHGTAGTAGAALRPLRSSRQRKTGTRLTGPDVPVTHGPPLTSASGPPPPGSSPRPASSRRLASPPGPAGGSCAWRSASDRLKVLSASCRSVRVTPWEEVTSQRRRPLCPGLCCGERQAHVRGGARLPFWGRAARPLEELPAVPSGDAGTVEGPAGGSAGSRGLIAPWAGRALSSLFPNCPPNRKTDERTQKVTRTCVDLRVCRACRERAFRKDSASSSRTGVRYDLQRSGQE